jgi:hypothetical protein
MVFAMEVVPKSLSPHEYRAFAHQHPGTKGILHTGRDVDCSKRGRAVWPYRLQRSPDRC